MIPRVYLASFAFAVGSIVGDAPMAAQTFPPSVIGRWDITVEAPGGRYPSWLEVRASGNRTLVGSFVGRDGPAPGNRSTSR